MIQDTVTRKNILKKIVTIACLFTGIFIICVLTLSVLYNNSRYKITIGAKQRMDTDYKVYYVDDLPPDHFDKARFVTNLAKRSTQFRDYQFVLPVKNGLKKIRLDLGDSPANIISLTYIRLDSFLFHHILDARAIMDDFICEHNISDVSVENNSISIHTSGPDPYIVLKHDITETFSSNMDKKNTTAVLLISFITALIIAGVFTVIVFSENLFKQVLSRLSQLLQSCGKIQYEFFVSVLLLIFIVFTLLLLFHIDFKNYVKVYINLMDPDDNVYELFYSTKDKNFFFTEQSVQTRIKGKKQFQITTFHLPTVKTITKIRIDPGRTAGTIYIKDIVVKKLFKSYTWSPEVLFKICRPNKYIREYTLENNMIKIIKNSPDPFITIPLNNDMLMQLNSLQDEVKKQKLFIIFILLIIFTSLVFFTFRHTHFFSTRFKGRSFFKGVTVALFVVIICLPLIFHVFFNQDIMSHIHNRIIDVIGLKNNTTVLMPQNRGSFFTDFNLSYNHYIPAADLIASWKQKFLAYYHNNNDTRLHDYVYFHGKNTQELKALLQNTYHIDYHTIKNNLHEYSENAVHYLPPDEVRVYLDKYGPVGDVFLAKIAKKERNRFLIYKDNQKLLLFVLTFDNYVKLWYAEGWNIVSNEST